MNRTTICAHLMVKNEDMYIEAAIKSVIESVDRLLICDTGSFDHTLKIIKTLEKKYSNIEFFQKKNTNSHDVGRIRQVMLDQTEEDWILILDGDEIWYEKQLNQLIKIIKQENSECVAYAVKYRNFIHSLDYVIDESMEKYTIKGIEGSHSVKLIKNDKNLKSIGDFGVEGYHLGNTPLQNHSHTKLYSDHISFCHMSFMRRSSSFKAYIGSTYRLRKLFTRTKFHKRNFVLPQVFVEPQLSQTNYFKVNIFSYLINKISITLCILIQK